MNVELSRNELIIIHELLDIAYSNDDLGIIAECTELDYDLICSLHSELFSKIDKILND